MITELGIGNFKAFADTQRVPIKPLTLIFGPNAAGKSSVIQALLLAHNGGESGEFDVHRTKLGGEMVDLGGFQNFVHNHDSGSRTTLRLETSPDAKALFDNLDGVPEERTPFCRFSRFGIQLQIGLAGDRRLSRASRHGAGIEEMVALIDGIPVLTLAWLGGDQFQAKSVNSDHPLIALALDSILQRSLSEGAGTLEEKLRTLAERREEKAAILSMFQELDATGDPGGVEGTASALREEPRPARAVSSLENERGRLRETFSRVVRERAFFVRGLACSDRGPDSRWDWAGWREWVEQGIAADGTLTGFFAEHQGEEECLWWPEAQTARYNLSNLVAFCTAHVRKVLKGLSYLGPLRDVPPRHLTVRGIQDPQDAAGGGLAWETLFQNRAVKETVNGWLGQSRLRTPFRIRPRLFLEAERVRQAQREGGGAPESLDSNPDLVELVFEDSGTGTIVSHRDIGFGVSQVLPVLVNAAAMQERLIAIEQPELHLHPAQQAELGDVFIESALGDRKNTFLLETHSEHLILRILRRVRETKDGKLPEGCPRVHPEDVAVVYVQPGAKGAEVRELPVTADGDFGCPWPGGFFAERFQELP